MTQLTQEDRQEILNDLLSALSTSCRKIEQLTQVNTLTDSNLFELAGGKKVSFATIKDVLATIVTNSISGLNTELLDKVKELIGQPDGIAPLDNDRTISYRYLPYCCVRFDKYITMATSKGIPSDESLVAPKGSLVAYNSVVRCFVLLTPEGNNYYRAWKGMQTWGYFNGNGATPHRGIIYWDGQLMYTFDNVLGLQKMLDVAGQTIPMDGHVLLSKADAVILVEKEFETPINFDKYE